MPLEALDPAALALWLLALAAGASLLLWLVAVAASHSALSRGIPEGGPTPPISILRPLKGLDDGLIDNLIALCEQDYPEYELLLGAEDPLDPALDVALRVKRAHPEVPIQLVVCRAARGKNPKVRVLQELVKRARFDWVLVSDSNVRPRRSYLRETAAELADPDVRLVTNPIAPAISRDESLGALLENLHLGTFVLASTCLVRALAGRALVIGKSMLLHKPTLAYLGGFASVRDVLAEDYLLGRKFERAGHKVVLSPHAIVTVNETWPVERFLQRHLRWGQMRRRISLLAYTGELLLNPVLWLALTAWCGRGRLGVPEVLALFAALALKVALDARLLGRLRGRPLAAADLAWLPVKDLLIAAIWPIALVRRTICWRENVLRIGRVSRLFAAPRRTRELASEPV